MLQVGLFINKFENEGLYKNNEELNNSNQNIYKIDPVAEYVNQQKLAISSLNDYLKVLESHVGEQSKAQSNRWNEIKGALKEQKVNDKKHTEFNQQVLGQINQLEEKNKGFHLSIENDRLIQATLSDKLATIEKENNHLMGQVKSSKTSNSEIMNLMTEQYKIQKEMSEKLVKHDKNQKEIIMRLESNEALTEKITRQLENLRFILFERSNFLAGKIEESYLSTSSYFNRLIKKSTQTALQDKDKKSSTSE